MFAFAAHIPGSIFKVIVLEEESLGGEGKVRLCVCCCLCVLLLSLI